MLLDLINLIRDRVFPPTMVSISVTKELVASGNTHDAGDYLNDSKVKSWIFRNAAKELGGSGYITKAQVHTEVEAQTERIALQVYTEEPTTTLTDDTAATSPNTTDEAFFEDEILLPALIARGDGSYSVATPGTAGSLPLAFTCEPGSRDLFIAVITLDATTHTATERMTVKLKIERLKTAGD